MDRWTAAAPGWRAQAQPCGGRGQQLHAAPTILTVAASSTARYNAVRNLSPNTASLISLGAACTLHLLSRVNSLIS